MALKHHRRIGDQLGIGSIPKHIGSWRYAPRPGSEDDGAQIDLLFDRADDTITICELKYAASELVVDKAMFRALKRKLRVFRERTGTAKQLSLVLVTATGVRRNNYYDELIDEHVAATDWLAP